MHAAVITALLASYIDTEKPIGEQPTITVRREMLRHARALLEATKELHTRAGKIVQLLEQADDPEDGTIVDFATEIQRIARKAGKHAG